MLEHVPHWLGRALSGIRAGAEKLAIAQPELAPLLPESLSVTSPAFADAAWLPQRFTADGDGVSPPLTWTLPPAGTAMLVLLVEDADAPTPQPLVHAVVWGIPADAGHLPEGAIIADGDGSAQGDVGRNSFLQGGWLPPDPPTGHGPHRYCFELFALGVAVGNPGHSPGRSDLFAAMAGHVIASGLLTGIYERGRAEARTTEGLASTS